MNSETVTFGERVVYLRKYNGLKQKELAAYLGIGTDMLSKYERGVHVMPDQMKVRVAEYFQVSLDYFFGLLDEPISIDRTKAVGLRPDFPAELTPKVKDYIRILYNDYKTQK